MSPQELYAEVAALYEVCYKAAHHQLQQWRMSMRDGSSHGGEAVASALESTSAVPMQPGKGRICFPWRIADQQLLEMKEKARQLAQTESLY